MVLESLKDFLRGTLIHRIYRFLKRKFYPYILKRAKVCAVKPSTLAIQNKTINNRRIIVSLTSFPDRMPYIHKTLYSLMNQDYKPNMIVLWLSKEQFENVELPKEVIELTRFGLTIRFVEGDIKSYKKLIPALRNFEDDIIVTADDDLYYPSNWLRKLVVAYVKKSDSIHCHLITRLCVQDGVLDSTDERKAKAKDSFSYFNKLLGGSGTLYPPHCLNPEVMNEKAILEIAPTSDDIWFWGMAVTNGTKIHWIPDGMKELYYVENTQENTPCLTNINDQGERLFKKHLNAVAKKYDIYRILRNEESD